MARRLRQDPGGVIYHVINRRAGRGELFEAEADYLAFERVLGEGVERFGMRVLCYCLMPNHWHLVLWPRRAGELSRFMQWVTVTHARRWHGARQSAGEGPVYQGRFKSFPVQEDGHFLTVCRYVERNPVRAGLVKRAERWGWSSLAWREGKRGKEGDWVEGNWPVGRGRDWVAWVNEPQTEAEVEALGKCVRRGAPYGEEKWVKRTAGRMGLESALRPVGRPRKKGGKTGVGNETWPRSLYSGGDEKLDLTPFS